MIPTQPNPYFGIHFLGAATERYAATYGERHNKFVIGHFGTLAEAITARTRAIEQKRKKQHA